MAFEVFRRGDREEIQQVGAQRRVERLHALAELARAQQFGQRLEPAPFGQVRRRLQRERAQFVGDRLEPALVLGQAFGITARELRDLRRGAPATRDEIAVVRQRQEVVEPALHDAQAVPREIEIGDHLRLQQRHRVRRDRIAEPRMELLGHRRAADHVAPFEHGDLQPRLGEISRADEAVVAAADQDRVAVVGRHRRIMARCTQALQLMDRSPSPTSYVTTS